MAQMLRYYRGGLTVADYDAMGWDRRQTLFEFMKANPEPTLPKGDRG